MPQLASIILAAGQGTRMKSKLPKVLHPLLGRPMLRYVMDAAVKAGSDPILIVVGFEGRQVVEAIGPGEKYIWQHEQLGTGHAVMAAKEELSRLSGDLLVLYGDTPLLREETLKELVELKRAHNACAAVLTTRMSNPAGYGRIIRDGSDRISAIVEDKDATPEQQAIKEVNTGVYCFDVQMLLAALDRITPHNAQGEYYLTDVFKVMVGQRQKIVGLMTPDAEEVMGPNDRVQLAQTERFLKLSINREWMRRGVTIEDPHYTYIGPEVTIGGDTVILPGTMILGKTVIGEGCRIGPHTRILDSTIGDGTIVQFSQVIEATLGPGNNVGPFAYLRPGTSSAARVKIGDFVEVKNSVIGEGSKVPHLTYLGDAQVGMDVNIGAGTITCNYDGVSKHHTVIGDGAFIGSNANLVAPVTIGAGATVAAGSTITKEVPGKSLAIARSKQQNLTAWVAPRDRAKQDDGE